MRKLNDLNNADETMKIAIVVFAYNRYEHLSKVLESLRENERADAFYIFQDSLKCEAHRNGWEKTRDVIENVDWCSVNKVYAEKNKGCAQSIIDGVNMVLEENDAIIVLEDDCVPAPAFVSFMKQCLKKYESEKQVYCISGYKWPIPAEQPKNQDIYFCGRTSSWGWGTWKDRWRIFDRDYEVIKRLRAESEGSRRLGMWGTDLECMLDAQAKNKIDAWDVFWSLLVIEKNGYCVAPYYELIHNIGNDGTGHHCGNNQAEYDVELYQEKNFRVRFPQEIAFQKDVIEAFASLFGSYALVSTEDSRSKEQVLIYGIGNFYNKYEKELVQKYSIKGYVDKYKEGYFEGKKILSLEQIKTESFDKIVIMLASSAECRKVAADLCENYDVTANKICWGESKLSISEYMER